MTPIAPTLQAFFSERLVKQLHASPRTIGSYRDSLSLLLRFVQDTTGKAPFALEWDELDEPLIAAFLEYLETERHNSARTCNLRLTAIRSLFQYVAVRHPEHAAVIARVQSIPPKRFQRRAVTFLTVEEAQALILVPPQDRWEGRRDARRGQHGDVDDARRARPLRGSDRERARRVLDRYLAAFEHSDMDAIERLLADDATLEMTSTATW